MNVIAEAMRRQPRVRRAPVPRGAALRGHRLQDRQPRVGVLVQARLPVPLPQQHLPAVVPLQEIQIPPMITLYCFLTHCTSCFI